MRAGINLGGVSPIPIPGQIQEITRFNPKFNGQIELVGTNWLTDQFGISIGLRVEQKGMETVAKVAQYQMELTQAGSTIAGSWTGFVRSSFSASYITLPSQAVYRFNDRVRVNGGLYLGYRFDGSFSGDVYDGYFRLGDSTGERIDFDKDAKTPYDFSEFLRPFELGLQLGGAYACIEVL